ncbi:MAG: hypothetical protein K2H42_03460, partial [Alistipes sp.]|nr:hypothetical protein [Alistipes sp.]
LPFRTRRLPVRAEFSTWRDTRFLLMIHNFTKVAIIIGKSKQKRHKFRAAGTKERESCRFPLFFA